MKTHRIAWILGLALFLLSATDSPGLVFADEPNRAGLVVQFGDGQIETRCLTLESDEISGADLLIRSGLDLVVDASSGMGITVCQIEGEGCTYPAEPCFCQCMGGGECAYWNYFYRDPGADGWTYSPLGAILRKVKPGSVEGWVWAGGDTPPADGLTFESICASPTPTPTEPPEALAPVSATVTAALTETQAAAPSPTARPMATSLPPDPTPSPVSEREQNLLDYWPFAVMVLGLGAVGIIVWLRRS